MSAGLPWHRDGCRWAAYESVAQGNRGVKAAIGQDGKARQPSWTFMEYPSAPAVADKSERRSGVLCLPRSTRYRACSLDNSIPVGRRPVRPLRAAGADLRAGPEERWSGAATPGSVWSRPQPVSSPVAALEIRCRPIHPGLSPSRQAIASSSTRTASMTGTTGRASKTKAGKVEQTL